MELLATRYAFEVDWADALAGQMKKYVLCYYPMPTGPPLVEMIDMKTKRIYLKRTPVANLELSELQIGAFVNVLCRQLKITDYGDEHTRKRLTSAQEHTLLMVKPDATVNLGQIIQAISNIDNISIANMRMVKLLRRDAETFYAEHQGKQFYDGLTSFMSSGAVVAIDVCGINAIRTVRQLNGPTDSSKARSENPGSLRARFGTDGRRNAVHSSDSVDSAARELNFFFQNGHGLPTATLSPESTLCIIKPHAKRAAGHIIQMIADKGYQITAARSFALDRVSAVEFLEVYKGVVPEYPHMIEEFTAGLCFALEVSGNGGQATFRDFCGPADPQIANILRKGTLRSQFGQDKVKNAVHCTDLPDDGPLELEYFFSIIANKGYH